MKRQVMDDSNLRWVKKDLATVKRVEASDSYLRTRERIQQITKLNPLIPIGIIGMWVALGKGLGAFMRGDRHASNKMMRYRIYFHVFTLVAITGSSVIAAAIIGTPEELQPNQRLES
ncbi:HIG1 domain family member 2A [Trichinella pseudospiralis]|uniref:HIG1 domain family member 2A n=3 Tax=Trichinella pseudospiralis TaxID=6337 RepID=A0A0V0Y421_TRIPS|nr:HIG1 domain family member 2A [Trichinella pseudospiralis]